MQSSKSVMFTTDHEEESECTEALGVCVCLCFFFEGWGRGRGGGGGGAGRVVYGVEGLWGI